MRIAYISNVRLPTEKAHGIQIMKMCEAFAAGGADIELIIPRRLNPIKTDIFEFYGVSKRFNIAKLWTADFLAIPYFKKIGFLMESLFFTLASRIYILKEKFSVYYTRDFLLALVFSFSHIPLFYEIHALPERPNFIYNRIWKKSKGLIVISRKIEKELLNLGIPKDKILIAYDAVDLEQFRRFFSREDARKKLGLPLDKKIVVYTGHLYDWKGAGALAETAPLLDGTDIYLIGGTGEDIEKYKLKYQNSNLKIIGWQNPKKIPLWLKAADLLVLPNSSKDKISAEYTSPLKLFEYMASGTPIIVSDVPAIKEILDSDTALFFEADNVQDLADKIQEALKNSDQMLKKAKLAQDIVKEYTWDRRANKILEFIKKSHELD